MIDSDNTRPARGVRAAVGRPARGIDKRTYRVNLSLSADEHEALSLLAQRDGVGSLARWVRDRVLNSITLDAMGYTGVRDREVAKLRADLNRVGNNLNQVALGLNAANKYGTQRPEDRQVLEAVEQVRVQIAEIRSWTRNSA